MACSIPNFILLLLTDFVQKHQEKGDADVSVKQPKQKLPRASTHQDPLAIRTVVISGLPSSLDSKVLWKKIRKYEGAEMVDYPSNATGEDHGTGMSACTMMRGKRQLTLRSPRLVFYTCPSYSGREQVARTCV